MKKIAFVFTLILTSLVFNSLQAQETGYNIKFKVSGLKEGGKVQFAYYQGDKKLLQDTVFVENGAFTLKGDKALPRGLYLVALPDYGFFDIVINEDQFFEFEAKPNEIILSAKVKGSEENFAFYQYLKEAQPFQEKLFKNNEQYVKDSCSLSKNKELSTCKKLYDDIISDQKKLKEIKDAFIKAHPTYLISKMFHAMEEVDVPLFEEIKEDKARQEKRFNYYKAHYFDNIDFNESGLLRTPIFEARINKYFEDITIKSCDSTKASANRVLAFAKDYDMFKYLLNFITTKYEKSNIMCMDCMSLHLFEKYYLTDTRVDWIGEETKKKLQEEVWKLQYNQCGEKVYPMVKSDTNGRAYDIMKVDAEYTIVYFWSATCGHCKKATPELQKMYNRIKDEYDVEVYTVHIDKSRNEFDKYVKEHKFDWILTIDDGKDENYRTAYNVFSTPTIYLLNNKKEIIAKKVDIATIEKIITGKESSGLMEEIH